MSGNPPQGWSLVAWTALVVGGVAGGILAWQGVGEEGVLLVLRATARTSLLLFLGVFLASTARGRWPNRATEWLFDNRRYLGVSFATSHTVHFAAILALTQMSARRPDAVVLLLGGLGYLFILAMVATSFDATAALLGARRWKRLHTAGIFYVWTVFVLTYLGNAAKDPKAAVSVFLLVGALAFRLARRRAPHAHATAH
jgi:DMSO/TMAO reductase YedYZ heme-binding membrane subunit